MQSVFKKSWTWLVTVLKSFSSKHCSMHAAGLTYYALLAVVPVLCVLLATAKMLGADQPAREKIHELFEAQISQFELDSGAKAEVKAAEVAAEAAEVAEETAERVAAAKTDEEKAEIAAEAAETAAEVAAEEEDEAAKKLAATQEFIKQARSIEKGLLEKIEQFHVGTLGWIGFLALVWTVISSIGMIELSFNEVWDVPKQRPIWKRAFLDLFVALVMPVLVTLAVTVPLLKLVKDIIVATAGSLWLTKWVSDGAVWLLDSWALRLCITLFFATLVFAFLFKVMPNCRVNGRASMRAGLVTAVFFGVWMKICAVAQVGIAKTSALYGSFAFLPIVLAWLFMSWQIVLLGCCMARAWSPDGK